MRSPFASCERYLEVKRTRASGSPSWPVLFGVVDNISPGKRATEVWKRAKRSTGQEHSLFGGSATNQDLRSGETTR